MRCYNHPENEAVGLCRNCGRGLCTACIVETGKWIACKNRCEKDAAAMQNANNNALEMSRTAKKARFLGPSFFILSGLVFAFFGFSNIHNNSAAPFAASLGMILLVWGIVFLIMQIRIARKLRS